MKRNFYILPGRRERKVRREEKSPLEQHCWTVVDTPQQLVRSRCTTSNTIIEGIV